MEVQGARCTNFGESSPEGVHVLIMLIGESAKIDQMSLLREGVAQLRIELAHYGFRMGRPTRPDPQVVEIPLSPVGKVTSVVARSTTPFVTFDIHGTNLDTKRILRNLGAHCARDFGVDADAD